MEIFRKTARDACETYVKCGQVVTRLMRVKLKRKTIRCSILRFFELSVNNMISLTMIRKKKKNKNKQKDKQKGKRMNKQSPPHLSHVTFISVGTFGCWDRCGGYMPVKNVALVQINPAYTFVFTLLCSLIGQQHLESKFAQNMTPPTRFLALQIFCVVCWLFFFLFFCEDSFFIRPKFCLYFFFDSLL